MGNFFIFCRISILTTVLECCLKFSARLLPENAIKTYLKYFDSEKKKCPYLYRDKKHKFTETYHCCWEGCLGLQICENESR